MKSNLGHLESAAGIAGLIKSVLILNHGTITPNLHFDKPNAFIDFNGNGLSVATEPTAIDRQAFIRVSGFGFSGTNAHLIVKGATWGRGYAVKVFFFAIFTVISKAVSTYHKVLSISMLSITSGMLFFQDSSVSSLYAYANNMLYFTALSLVVHFVQTKYDVGSASGDILAAIMLVLYVIIPSYTFSNERIPTTGIGFDYAFSAYSYCKDVSERKRNAPLGTFMFFILVNPCYIFNERGRMTREGKSRLRYYARVIYSALLFYLGYYINTYEPNILGVIGRETEMSGWNVSSIAAAIIFFFSSYWIFSGMIGVSIGMLGIIGYSVPECFNMPFLAKGPTDFWKRWNLYLGRWRVVLNQ